MNNSVHIVMKERYAGAGYLSASVPDSAHSTRKHANKQAKKKNEAATSCGYWVKSVKLMD